MTRISGFIISAVLLLLTALEGVAGVPDDSGSDTPGAVHTPGLRFGLNVSRPLWRFVEPARMGFEAVGDFSIGPEYFGVAEAGYSLRDLDEPAYRLKERGVFLRIGGDKGLYRDNDDLIAVGARLGVAAWERAAPRITVEPGYWGEYAGTLESDIFIRQWAEVVLVLKTELFSNVFIGWNIRGKLLLFDRGDRHMSERYIPGFGAGETGSTFGFDFYIYYRFSLRK